MKRILCVAVLATLTFGDFCRVDAANSIAAPTTEPMKTATAAEAKLFRKLYADSDAALHRRDISSMSKSMTDEFTLFLKSGSHIEKPQLLSVLKQMMQRTIRFNQVKTQVTRVSILKNVVSVSSTSTIDMVYRGLDEKTHRSITVTQVVDSWIRTKQGWRQQNSQEVSTLSTVDGRPYVASL